MVSKWKYKVGVSNKVAVMWMVRVGPLVLRKITAFDAEIHKVLKVFPRTS